MTKVLHVKGEFAAQHIEDEFGVKDAFELADESEDKIFILENEFVYAECEAYEFGTIDPAFEVFLKNEILDYDAMKDNNFFIIEED